MSDNTDGLEPASEMSFWDHLDDLRGTLIRISLGIVICMAVVFLNKEIVFEDIVFAATSDHFILYRGMCALAEWLSMPSMCPDPFQINMINTAVSGQFFMHISTSFWFGFVLSFPWIIYQLWLFIRPALYENERKNATSAFFAGSILFFMGAAVGYFLVFPLTIKFLGTYQVAANVENMIDLGSYIDTLVVLVLAMGVVFELPILIFILSKFGLVTKAFLREYRRYAIVAILIVAALITPTADPFTMLAVSVPILLLYEFSIWICTR